MNGETICRTRARPAKLVLPQPSWAATNLVLPFTENHIRLFLALYSVTENPTFGKLCDLLLIGNRPLA